MFTVQHQILNDWKTYNKVGGIGAAQTLCRALIADGYAGARILDSDGHLVWMTVRKVR